MRRIDGWIRCWFMVVGSVCFEGHVCFEVVMRRRFAKNGEGLLVRAVWVREVFCGEVKLEEHMRVADGAAGVGFAASKRGSDARVASELGVLVLARMRAERRLPDMVRLAKEVEKRKERRHEEAGKSIKSVRTG